MEKTTKEKFKKQDANGKYLTMLFSMFKNRGQSFNSMTKTHFNATEIRLMGEVLLAEYEGRRLISTRLAEILGITRSAVSQIVNNLEKEGVIRRVPDEVDRKIAYIEVTEEALEKYSNDLRLGAEFAGNVVKKFGEEKFATLYVLLKEFTTLIEEEKKNQMITNKVRI